MKALEQADSAHIWHPFTPLPDHTPIVIKKGRGSLLYTYEGRKIIDGISSWWVNIHGHGNRAISKAIAQQTGKLEQVIFAGFTHKPAIELAKSLKKILPSDQSRIFFSDDGSTSVEVAIKLAIQYWHNLGKPRRKIIAIEGGYHGDTFGAMSVGERSMFTNPFNPFLFEVAHIPFPVGDGGEAIRMMKELASDETAAFIFEPLLQGAAGMLMYKPEVLDQLISVAKEKQILCIADEVMTGFGRTGRLLASDYLIHKPDIFCLSKGITGGFLPLGVTAVNERVVRVFEGAEFGKTFFHGHSYTANPIACAAANASMKLLLKEETKANIARISKRHEGFRLTLPMFKQVREVRQLGTVLAIELHAPDAGYGSDLRGKIYDFFMSRNILLRPLGNVFYILPPYVITDRELDLIYKAILEFLKEGEADN